MIVTSLDPLKRRAGASAPLAYAPGVVGAPPAFPVTGGTPPPWPPGGGSPQSRPSQVKTTRAF